MHDLDVQARGRATWGSAQLADVRFADLDAAS
jgi:hypothetical protein